ncbi:hypothetical protein GCM10010392_55620 [Streptomyces clavifer]|nr:hypothetical protein GCM10010392_55620 [Streptomyces clavifer]
MHASNPVTKYAPPQGGGYDVSHGSQLSEERIGIGLAAGGVQASQEWDKGAAINGGSGGFADGAHAEILALTLGYRQDSPLHLSAPCINGCYPCHSRGRCCHRDTW